MAGIDGRVALVTGSGQGIGKAIALELARQGAKVITNSRKPGTKGGDAESTAYEIMDFHGQAMAFYGAVNDFQAAGKMVQAAIDRFGRLDIVVNNAGADAPHMIWNMTEEEWDLSIDSYLKGTFNTCRFACALMREQKWGRIINTTSTAWLGTVGHCNYGAAKAGVVQLTKTLAVAWAQHSIRVNAVAPGVVETNMTAPMMPFEQLTAPLLTRTPMQRFATAGEIAPAVLFLASPAAGYITGQTLAVDGGFSIAG